MSVTIDLHNQTALVTGGTRGIGKAIAEMLHQAGANVIITGTKKAGGEMTVFTGDRKQYMEVDFTDRDSVSFFLKQINELGRIDMLVNNAGINRINLNTETSEEDYDLLNNINLKGPYLLSREVSRLMKKNNYGRIVNIASIWSVISRPGRSLYTLTKAGIAGLTRTLAVELGNKNILVNTVSPGFTLTELTASTNSPEEIEKLASLVPLQRMAEPSEIAAAVLFLCSNLNTYLTGQNIIVDGGYTNV